MHNDYNRSTLYTGVRFYNYDNSYTDVPLWEIPLTNNKQDTASLLVLLVAGLAAYALLKD